jgi:signal transduction histidine kinase
LSQKSGDGAFQQQLESLYSISIEIAMLHELPPVLDRALGYCLDLTESEFGFVGLLDSTKQMMDVAAIKGFQPPDPRFYDRFQTIPVRPNLFGIVLREGHSVMSDDVVNDPRRVGQPYGHPPVRTYLGTPLRVGDGIDGIIGMIGVANRAAGYSEDNERLLTTFANQVAVAINNTRLYANQREMIKNLELLHHQLDEVERERVLRQERERIAAELHDRIEQGIFAIGLQVNSELDRPDVPPETAKRLVEIRRLAAKLAEATKEAVFALSSKRPSGDLPETLRKFVGDLARSAALEVDLVVSGEPVRLDPATETVLGRIAHGALWNVVGHSKATMALVSLRYSDDHVDLVVQDDGVGAPELVLENYAESETHFGLRSMRRQVEELGGTFTVSNGEEGGLAVRVRVTAPTA